MATYVIGDLQGCFEPLQRLLAHIHYQAEHDELWFCGDLIARGPDSLACLDFVRGLGAKARVVLGNHDLNFIASYYGFSKVKAADQLTALQQAAHLPELIHWLCQQPLIQVCTERQLLMVHAGLAPEWDISTALSASAEISALLQHQPTLLLSTMYGNTPSRWRDVVTQEDRWRFTINACTRMRFCQADGALELLTKSGLNKQSKLKPWFELWQDHAQMDICFGHWAALEGYSPIKHIHALDTGCVWGNQLTAYCVETRQRYSVDNK
ncbi:symmetrical bis(5'-nucleosyl)-tetraphosphatase [Alishewanella sp. SMS8]|uniref:symmetrical bis(5'-nucleosyl)-tetraphosphatase n=1 Tax=unclassified Alishewanella TaxID=2628974 RepID=UPI0027406F6A|nr:symmetrical bis(5'-nucleosyl)-tetraphosphatase [Alishewanella sp. SMS8]MDP4944983.1 symmetrical bis(5'-nucleosyl)-tetraphosphatase [Alishewanella sp.]MDP5035978.1 symmetrical bis(5'-nucleosyl)-tetraphosphatase [Alishewanella sp.]MDP5207266.1 symmetrical bis(5'-nucleosyl)-tetraphosphatase [Alishewanella sp. SMS9]MDP5459717.1 symmetrical bis(5'-nucleosyl)-tetraphosphatase [Alishewanella sp. SMS8]